MLTDNSIPNRTNYAERIFSFYSFIGCQWIIRRFTPLLSPIRTSTLVLRFCIITGEGIRGKRVDIHWFCLAFHSLDLILISFDNLIEWTMLSRFGDCSGFWTFHSFRLWLSQTIIKFLLRCKIDDKWTMLIWLGQWDFIISWTLATSSLLWVAMYMCVHEIKLVTNGIIMFIMHSMSTFTIEK